jgi:putative Mg2+ transporter-C (MgtC) family protein
MHPENGLNGAGIMASAGDLLAAYAPHVRDLAIAYALAFVIGWNRERQSRGAGLRTFPLVAIASCGFVQAAEPLVAGNPDALARIVAGVVTGIGFIGAGSILKGGHEVHGTATAASVWATGAIGAAVALGSYGVAVVICLFTAVTLYVLTPLKSSNSNETENGDQDAQ